MAVHIKSFESNIDNNKWVKVIKNGPSKICGRQPLKNLEGYDLHVNFFKDCLPQMLLGPFLNTLTQMFDLHFQLLTLSVVYSSEKGIEKTFQLFENSMIPTTKKTHKNFPTTLHGEKCS